MPTEDEVRGVKGYKDPYGGQGWIVTYTGDHFDFSNPEYRIRDIAHALAMTVRYGGHADRFYSVAEHSLMVAWLMENVIGGDPLEGLMHDATEAYLSDVPAPFKQFLPDWREHDKRLEAALREQYHLPQKRSDECTKADWIALYIEAVELIPGQGADFADPNNYREEALAIKAEHELNVQCLQPLAAEHRFITRYSGLILDRHAK